VPDLSQSSHRAERLLVPAAFITCLGNSIQLTAAALLVLQAERSTLAVGWLFIVVAIPQALLSLLFGRLADRFDRRWLCVACDLTGASAALVLPVWLLLGGPAGIGAYVSNFVLAIVAALFMPASNALIRERVRPERLGAFNANFEIATQAGTLLSTAVGGFMVQWFGAEPLFFFNAATFLASASCMLALGRRPAQAPVEQGVAAAGPGASPDGPPLARLGLLYALGNVVTTVWNTIIVVLVIEVLRQGAGVLGVVDALAGVGILLAAASYKWISPRMANLRLALVGYLSCAALLVLEPFGLVGVVLCVPLAALAFGLARVAARTLLMSAVPHSHAGRVFGATNAFGLAFSVAVTLAISNVVDRTEVRYGFLMLALVVGATALATVAALRHARVAHETGAPSRVVDSHPGAATLQGRMDADDLAPLLAFLARLNVSGVLRITNDPFQGTVCLEHGRVIGATFETETGVDALEAIALLMVDQGRFAFTEAVVEDQRNLSVDPDRVLSHLGDLTQERARLSWLVPSLTAIPRVAVREPARDGSVILDSGVLRLLLLADSRRTVADLVRTAPRAAATFRQLGQLVELELAEMEPASNGHNTRRRGE
jgi:MFS family permease